MVLPCNTITARLVGNMSFSLKKYILCLPALSYLLVAVLMPYLHMGGIICPHSNHSSSSHLSYEPESESGTPGYSDDCGDDAECQICSFHANYSAVKGIVSICLSTYHANFVYKSVPAEINLPGKIYSSNPTTAPPLFI